RRLSIRIRTTSHIPWTFFSSSEMPESLLRRELLSGEDGERLDNLCRAIRVLFRVTGVGEAFLCDVSRDGSPDGPSLCPSWFCPDGPDGCSAEGCLGERQTEQRLGFGGSLFLRNAVSSRLIHLSLKVARSRHPSFFKIALTI